MTFLVPFAFRMCLLSRLHGAQAHGFFVRDSNTRSVRHDERTRDVLHQYCSHSHPCATCPCCVLLAPVCVAPCSGVVSPPGQRNHGRVFEAERCQSRTAQMQLKSMCAPRRAEKCSLARMTYLPGGCFSFAETQLTFPMARDMHRLLSWPLLSVHEAGGLRAPIQVRAVATESASGFCGSQLTPKVCDFIHDEGSVPFCLTSPQLWEGPGDQSSACRYRSLFLSDPRGASLAALDGWPF